MGLKPELNMVCGRCGKPRGLIRHHCVSNSSRKATVKPALSFGTCPKCKKPVTSPLTHVCRPESDFKKRKAAAARREAAPARKKRQQSAHDYQACADRDCPRPLCVAFKTGEKIGYDRGFGDGFSSGLASGMASASA